MKAFTDLDQSRKLAEILPLESADMAWCNNSIKGVNYTDEYSANLYTIKEMQECFDKALNGWDKYWELIPCWSLAALLDILPKYIGGSVLRIDMSENDFNLWFDDLSGIVDEILPDITKDNPIDSCVEMIIKLHELHLL